MPVDEWNNWNKRVQENLNKLENTITTTKRNKFERDQMDYNSDKVYSWHKDYPKKFTTKSILKKRNKFSSSSPHHSRNVSFSDFETSIDTTHPSEQSAMSEYSTDPRPRRVTESATGSSTAANVSKNGGTGEDINIGGVTVKNPKRSTRTKP